MLFVKLSEYCKLLPIDVGFHLKKDDTRLCITKKDCGSFTIGVDKWTPSGYKFVSSSGRYPANALEQEIKKAFGMQSLQGPRKEIYDEIEKTLAEHKESVKTEGINERANRLHKTLANVLNSWDAIIMQDVTTPSPGTTIDWAEG